MALPYFFEETLLTTGDMILSEPSSKHIAQVLRMKMGEHILITDGKGKLVTAEIILPHKKNTAVKCIDETFIPDKAAHTAIAISLIKNTTRFEWFAEKATEIGIKSIIPLLCKRTEKTHFRHDRVKGIMISAMLQSRQAWLPELTEPQKITDFIVRDTSALKMIAYCTNDHRQELKEIVRNHRESKSILIGPEGDFTPEEIEACTSAGYIPVSLGETRLRTETAGVAAAVWMQ